MAYVANDEAHMDGYDDNVVMELCFDEMRRSMM